ncbi:MAG: hypothetical protein ACOWYE_11080 [Desulfatiglandales bacterium]
MGENKGLKLKLSLFGRNLALLLNRATMYHVNHPSIGQSIDTVYEAAGQLFHFISPLVFILNREQFYIDEEPLDPRINVARIANHFNRCGIQSVSFDKGLRKSDLKFLVEIETSLLQYPNADAMKKALKAKGIKAIKINHVLYKKVSADDEVIAREVLKNVTPEIADSTNPESKKMIIESLLESVLMEEFVKTLNLQNVIKDPGGLSKNMIEVDLKSVQQPGHEGQSPGMMLLQQLHVIDKEVEKKLSEGSNLELPQLAEALFDVRRQLMDGIEAKKALGVAYPDEDLIVEKTNEITDRVLIRLIREEYKAGKTSASRMAQIIRRLVPEHDELKRLLPKIKAALIEEGMALSEYLELVQELGRELQSEGLAKILAESSEEIGVDGERLVQELKKNPLQTAELIYLAGEIRKGTGDEEVLSELLVEYVERLGSHMAMDVVRKEGVKEEQHLKTVMSDIRSDIVGQLERLDINGNILCSLEEKLNQRMDELINNLKIEWLKSRSDSLQEGTSSPLSVLETLERSVSEDEELGHILKIIRSKVDSGLIDENDFTQIYTEIIKEKQKRKAPQAGKETPAGVIKYQSLVTIIEKEMARSKRYDTPFAALGFSLVTAKSKTTAPAGSIKSQDLTDALLIKLADIFRDSDIVGEFGRNRMVALLPMTPLEDARLALRRAMKLLHFEPIEVNGVSVDVKVAGVLLDMDFEKMPNARSFVDILSIQLSQMITRIKNIHAYT